MKIKLHHVDFVSRKISREILHCAFVEVRKTKDDIAAEVKRILTEDIEHELALDEKVNEILDSQESEIEFYQADYKQLFWMAKKKLAVEFDVILSQEDRFSDIAHKILDVLWEEDFIHYTVDDNKIKNVIINALNDFIAGFDEADHIVHEKIKNYKRKLIPGTEEYDLIFHRLYEEELIRKGII